MRFFFFSSRRRHTSLQGDWSSDVCSSDLRALQRRDAMRIAVRSAIPIGGDPPVSLFDVFWDLGASDFALEMMAKIGRASCRERKKLCEEYGNGVIRKLKQRKPRARRPK